MRQVGNRRSIEELTNLQNADRAAAYKLEDQEEFTGTHEELVQMQNFERAYIDGKPLISDEEWDILKAKFHYHESLTAGAPSGRTWVKLLSPLPSINKAGNKEEFFEFINRFDDDTEFKVECKLDGLTANVRFTFDKERLIYKFDCITSRGNGRYGLKLNEYALAGVKLNFPKELPAGYVANIMFDSCDVEKYLDQLPSVFELRGEAVIPKNSHTIAKYGKDSVWRSIASGMFNRKVPFNIRGLVEYLYNQSLEELIPEGCFFTVEDFSNAKLIHSLFSDKPNAHPFKKKDQLFIFDDGSVKVIYNHIDPAQTVIFENDIEELDIVFYSVSINGSNIDTSKINFPRIKTVQNIDFAFDSKDQTVGIGTTFIVTKDKNKIWEKICEFYGTDSDGKRDFSKPRLRNLYEYAIDGVVIKPVNSNNDSQKLSFRNNKNNPNKIVCPKYPEDQIAVKLLSEMVPVKLVDIEHSNTSLNNTTCTGILDKPYSTESGAMVSKINLHNPEWLEKNDWIKTGEKYYMVMSMDIIPVLLDPSIYGKPE